jgi:hypothetical protein
MKVLRFVPSVWAALWLASAAAAWSQNLLPNPGFEEGLNQPVGWQLADGAGQWGKPAHDGQHGISVSGNGNDSSYWRTSELPLRPGLYRLQFWGRREPGAKGGTAVAGPSRVNRDFPLSDTWRLYRFIFRMPNDAASDYVRLGQWQVKGEMRFDDAELVPVQAVHTRFAGDIELGQGESIRDGQYRFRATLDWVGADYCRPLATNRAGFNSNRWLFSPGAEVVYRHRLGPLRQLAGQVRVGINHHVSGTLRVEASADGNQWTEIAEFDGNQRGGLRKLPASLFPANGVFIRLSQAGPGAGFQVNTYEYESALASAPLDLEGQTHFLEVLQSHPDLTVQWQNFEPSSREGLARLDLLLRSRLAQPRKLRGRLVAEGEPGRPSEVVAFKLGPSQTAGVGLRCRLDRPGEHALKVVLEDETGRSLFTGQTSVRIGFLADRSFGYLLSRRRSLGVWWCESGWKVGRDRGLPDQPEDRRNRSVRVSAARGECEAAQVVLRPALDGALESAEVGPLRNARGETGAIAVRLDEVAYVRVTQPTDSACLPGWYPDPLPPLRMPLPLRAGQNQPLWLTFHVRPEAQPGDYTGTLRLRTSHGSVTAPLAVQVFDSALPQETHLRSALGLGAGEISRYHHLTNQADQQAVFEKYLRNFAAHRISPYSFYDSAPIDVQFVGEGAGKVARLDFTLFDRAASRWLDEHKFNTFQLPLIGMGGGSFHSRHLGELAGFKEGAPEHTRLFRDYLGQVEAHLRERGWLDKAFIYWFDEPDPKDYEFVIEGMKRLKTAAPGLKRMLTEQPEPALLEHVDIWCGLTPEWTPERVRERRAAGQQVWWYICTGPKAPYVTEFIDHPGTELRLWPWQSWQYGVTGILIWATIYWNSPLVYPAPQLQNPWEDPMSWVSNYGFPVGHVSPWGNGDGRFLYPPRRNPNLQSPPCLDEPINSLRWKNLRDGMEDYEYFWLLEQEVRRVKPLAGGEALAAEAEQLLKVPPEVSQDLTHFATDPRLLLRHRQALARMIERLRKVR